MKSFQKSQSTVNAVKDEINIKAIYGEAKLVMTTMTHKEKVQGCVCVCEKFYVIKLQV